MIKCLIVDDVGGWRQYNRQIIENLFKEVEIVEANSAQKAYEKILEYNNKPFDIVITDLQMEDFYSPKYAGEWLIEQIKTLNNYYKTKIIIISGSYNIKNISENYGVEFIPKSTAYNFPAAYEDKLKDTNND